MNATGPEPSALSDAERLHAPHIAHAPTRPWVAHREGTCSWFSRREREPLAGTAPTTTAYLLIEHGGPWGAKILRDVPFLDAAGCPTGLASRLAELHGVTPLLIRRHLAPHGVPARATVAVATFPPARGARTQVSSLAELAAWDLRALVDQVRAGALPEQWEPLPTSWLTCTHSKRDRCCAELGRPVAGEFAALDPENAWEVSHLGGHRLGANTLVLPEGVHYGHMDLGDAAALVAAHRAGRLLLGRLRGRSCSSPAVQAAEAALREHLGLPAVEAVRLVAAESRALSDGDVPPDHGPLTLTEWEVSPAAGDAVERWRVAVLTIVPSGPPVPVSCGEEPTTPSPRQLVRGMERIALPAGRP